MKACSAADLVEDAQPGNDLLVGDKAKVAGALDLPVQQPAALNYKTRAEVLDLRSSVVRATPDLVSDYVPNSSVFSKIEDGKPWWGIVGQGVYGPGPKASEGMAEESRFILNPYLLAGANPAVNDLWLPDKITADDLALPDFPFCWLPISVRIDPAARTETVTYDVSAFNRELNVQRQKLRKQVIMPFFGIVAYNARDFNFKYIYWDPKQSINVENLDSSVKAEAVKIDQMIHCGGTCKIPGGCNNMSPRMNAIDRIKYKQLPAKVCVLLWREQPVNVAASPDMTVSIELK